MPTIIRQHIINMIEPLGWLCDEGLKWLEEECYPSDNMFRIYNRFLKHAETNEKFRKWLEGFLYNLTGSEYGIYAYKGIDEAEALLWHHNRLQPPETAEGWREVFEAMPVDHRDIEECLALCHMNWEDRQQELEESDD